MLYRIAMAMKVKLSSINISVMNFTSLFSDKKRLSEGGWAHKYKNYKNKKTTTDSLYTQGASPLQENI